MSDKEIKERLDSLKAKGESLLSLKERAESIWKSQADWMKFAPSIRISLERNHAVVRNDIKWVKKRKKS